MRFLVTGGCGFLGSNLAAEVLRRGDALVVFDNLSRRNSELNRAWLERIGNFSFRYGDIRNREDIESVIRTIEPEVIFHLAGQVAMTTSLENPRLDFETNALGTFNVLDSVRRFSPGSLVIYSSTNKVYGDLEWANYREDAMRYVAEDYPRGFSEEIPLSFHSPYGCSKGAADQYMLDFHRLFGLKTTVFRHSSMYGARQFATFDQGWIGWFCMKASEIQAGLANETFTISGNGKQVRDVLHVKDIVALYFLCLERQQQACGEVFNIGGGMENSLSLLELFALLEKQLSIRMAFRTLPPRVSDQRVFVADISKASRLLGWRPKVTASEGIEQMLGWTSEALHSST